MYVKTLGKIQFFIRDMKPHNRMIRLGVGQHKGLWFIRLDLWWKSFRISRAYDAKLIKE